MSTSRICVRTANSASERQDQDVDHTFGGPLTIGSQAYVRNIGERAEQIERIKATARFQAFILRGSPKTASTSG